MIRIDRTSKPFPRLSKKKKCPPRARWRPSVRYLQARGQRARACSDAGHRSKSMYRSVTAPVFESQRNKTCVMYHFRSSDKQLIFSCMMLLRILWAHVRQTKGGQCCAQHELRTVTHRMVPGTIEMSILQLRPFSLPPPPRPNLRIPPPNHSRLSQS